MSLPNVDPAQYDALLAAKAERLREMFSGFEMPALEVFESPKEHYRMRAEFRVWHEGDDLYYVMFEPGDKHARIRVDACPMVAKPIHDVMFKLLDLIRDNPKLRFKLFQVDFLSTLSGELLISMLYHRPLEDDWADEAAALGEQLGAQLIGRSRKKKLVLDKDYVIETLPIRGRNYDYKQVENCFTQPNAQVCTQMIEWALSATDNSTGQDLVEFYCGNGNFTLPLAQNFRRVVATEIAKVSVRAAEFNIERNGIENVDVLRMPSEDLSLILQGKKQSRKTEGLKLDECNFSTVLVDPPRAGLDDHTVAQVCEYDNIIYISCNPETLQENLKTISKTHKVERFALFDQFPYTDHMESGVYLTRR